MIRCRSSAAMAALARERTRCRKQSEMALTPRPKLETRSRRQQLPALEERSALLGVAKLRKPKSNTPWASNRQA
jgi:hypothetical protein